MVSIPDLANEQGIRKDQSEIISCVVVFLTSMNWEILLVKPEQRHKATMLFSETVGGKALSLTKYIKFLLKCLVKIGKQLMKVPSIRWVMKCIIS